MRDLIWIVLIGFFFSCTNKNRMMESEFEDFEVSESKNYELILKELSLEDLTSQKLIDYYDLLQLKDSGSSEFQEDVIHQLRAFSGESLLETDSLSTISIRNIHQIGDVEQVSDSVQKIKLRYEVYGEYADKSDSIYAIITSKNVLIDKVKTKSTNVIFSKIN
ncbi:MAG: hypothetical protein AB8B59_08700 [Maribacter sp.]